MLSARDLSFAYARSRGLEQRVLDHVSIEVQRGTVVGLLGPNGSGKTTLLKLVAGVLSPQSGRVEIDGRPIEQLTRRERAENVKKRDVFAKYGDQARAVLDALLAKYADEGMLNLDDANVLRIPPLSSLGTPVQLIKAFGGKEAFVAAIRDVQAALYWEAS